MAPGFFRAVTTLEQRIAHAGDQSIALMARVNGLLRLEAEAAAFEIVQGLMAAAAILTKNAKETDFSLAVEMVRMVEHRVTPSARGTLQKLSDKASGLIRQNLLELAETDQRAKAEALQKATDKRLTVSTAPLTAEERHDILSMKHERRTAVEHATVHCENALKRIAQNLPILARSVKRPDEFLISASAVIKQAVAIDLANRLIQTFAGFASDVIALNNKQVLAQWR